MFYNLLGLYEMLELECAGCSTKTWLEGCIGEKQNTWIYCDIKFLKT